MADVEVVGTPEIVKVIARGPQGDPGAGGGGSTSDSWLLVYQNGDLTVGPNADNVTTLLWDTDPSNQFGNGTDISLNADGIHIDIATDGLYEFTYEPNCSGSSGSPTGYTTSEWHSTGAVDPSWWTESNIGDLAAVNPKWPGGGPFTIKTPIVKCWAGMQVWLRPQYVDVASATVTIHGSDLYVVKIAGLS